MKGRFQGVFRQWDFATGKELFAQQIPGRVSALAFAPDGKTLAVASWEQDPKGPPPLATINNLIQLWDLAPGQERAKLTGHSGPIQGIAFSPDGKLLLSAAEDRTIRLWDVATAAPKSQTVTGGQRRPKSVAFSPDGRTAATCELFGETLTLWEIGSGREIRQIQATRSMGSVLAFSPDGRFLASGSAGISSTSEEYDYDVHVWEVMTGQKVLTFQPGGPTTFSLAFAPDGKSLLTGMVNGTGLIWDVLPRGATRELGLQGLEKCWADLAGDDAAGAYRAFAALAHAPRESVAFLKDRLPPNKGLDPDRVRKLLAGLASDRFAEREAAAQELGRLGDQVHESLRQALAQNPPPEVRRRLEALLAQPQGVPPPEVRLRLRAILALEHIGSEPARHVLKTLAAGAAAARETQEARASLERLAGGGLARP